MKLLKVLFYASLLLFFTVPDYNALLYWSLSRKWERTGMSCPAFCSPPTFFNAISSLDFVSFNFIRSGSSYQQRRKPSCLTQECPRYSTEEFYAKTFVWHPCADIGEARLVDWKRRLKQTIDNRNNIEKIWGNILGGTRRGRDRRDLAGKIQMQNLQPKVIVVVVEMGPMLASEQELDGEATQIMEYCPRYIAALVNHCGKPCKMYLGSDGRWKLSSHRQRLRVIQATLLQMWRSRLDKTGSSRKAHKHECQTYGKDGQLEMSRRKAKKSKRWSEGWTEKKPAPAQS